MSTLPGEEIVTFISVICLCNNKKDTATRSMITFLVLNTSGLTIIPTTVISLRIMYGSTNPMKIISGCIIATICSTVGGLFVSYVFSRRKKY